MWTVLVYLGLSLLELAVIARAILRPNRDPASRIAWVVVIAVFPGLGIVAYLMLGETNIGRKKAARARDVAASLPPAPAASEKPEITDRAISVFNQGEAVNGFKPVAGNRAALMADSVAGIDAMVADMDAASDHIHLIFYIWLTDTSGLKIVEAVKRAATRGVTCRVMADGLGSRALIASTHWQEMIEAGVHAAIALPLNRSFLRPRMGRFDLRNHRKIVIIDDRITYCGSQNCADPEFRVKARFAPWVDALIRFEGPIARQNQYVFLADWMTYVDEDVRHLLEAPMPVPQPGFVAQVIATGPTIRNFAMPETFVTLMHSARESLVVTTPYYVPNESMQLSLCAAAHRGVKTTIIFPARNDSWIVGAASRSYYRELLAAGVRIFEYIPGLLHTKSMTIDSNITLIGSANLDRRSFDLNYENNIMFQDDQLTASVQQRQEQYLANSQEVTLEQVDAWPLRRRLLQNIIAMLGPVL